MWIVLFIAVILFECWIAQSGEMIIQSLGKNDSACTVPPPSQPPGWLTMVESPTKKRIFRAAPLPIFIVYFFLPLITSLVVFLPYINCTQDDIIFLIVLSLALSTATTLFIWCFTTDILSAKGVETWTPRGRRLLSWKEVSAVQSFPILRLVRVRFTSAAGRSLWLLFVQRRAGEFREMIIDFVPKDSLIWTQLKDA